MVRTLPIGITLLALLLCAMPAQANPVIFTAPLSGDQEVPPNASPGTGLVQIDFDTGAQTLRLVVQFSGLGSNTTAAHIHLAPPGVNGAAITPNPALPGFPLGVTSGMFDQTFDLTQPSFYTAAFLANNGDSPAQASASLFDALMTGGAYFNIHTVNVPAGEIRGNLSPAPQIPLLSPWLLVAAGGALGWLGWRRTRGCRGH